MFYPAKTPVWVKKLFPGSIWDLPGAGKTLYLTFDDGPHPRITPFVLEELKKYNARATFFCIGKNAEENPGIYKRILDEGHSVGNHTYSHRDGWRTGTARYIADVLRAKTHIESCLFRPPYGRITRKQRKCLQAMHPAMKNVMWSVLSGDFDQKITGEKCLDNVVRNAENGAVIVFHDSDKAWERMQYALPAVLKWFTEKGFSFNRIEPETT